MDIKNLITSIMENQMNLQENYCLVSRNLLPLKSIENMGYNEFSMFSAKSRPLKLYKYFPNKWEIKDNYPVNYSLYALKNNTVFMQSPNLFDDIYDSSIRVEWNDYLDLRLKIYCERCKCPITDDSNTQELLYQLSKKLYSKCAENQNVFSVFESSENSEQINLVNQLFVSNVLIYLKETNDWNLAIIKAIRREYTEYGEYLQKTFRISCFATTPFSQLMWGGSYADEHRGFCLEYTIDLNSEDFQKISPHLFPMIYCSNRSNITKELVNAKDEKLSEKMFWDIHFHGTLRKSIDWAYQDEWRFLLPFGKGETNYNVKFFDITKVYLGNRMNKENRKEIIEICKSKKIPYIGVTKDNAKFEMKECAQLCEDCVNYIG